MSFVFNAPPIPILDRETTEEKQLPVARQSLEAKFEFASESGLPFAPGGGFFLGFTPLQHKRLWELLSDPRLRANSAFESDSDREEFMPIRSFRRSEVTPTLVARKPVGIFELSRTLHVGIESLDECYDVNDDENCPASMTFDVAESFCRATGLCIPTEGHWECMARALQHELFVQENEMVIQDPERFLAPMSLDSDEILLNTSNHLGVAGIGLCREWTRDMFRGPVYDNASSLPDDRIVCGGGAAELYPWQHTDEWVIGSITSRESCHTRPDVLPNTAALRPVFEIDFE